MHSALSQIRLTRAAFAFCGALLGALAPAAAQTHGWAQAAVPAAGAAHAIGTYNNGCIQGAEALPLDGTGWRVIRPQRNRYWGHPTLIAVVARIGQEMHRHLRKNILVADIAQPRGGPVDGHASHQVGLDADIRFVLVGDGTLDAAIRWEGAETSMLVPGVKEIDRTRWTQEQVLMLRTAAAIPEVDRIFVNPVIKRELCQTVGGDRSWLAKIQPWYGHDGHMHVRVHCPPGSTNCARQAALNGGDGCGAELARWFAPEQPRRQARVLPRPRPLLPQACAAVLAAPMRTVSENRGQRTEGR
jgi:penicillin-insensitive murein endopeptidase